MPPRGGGSGTAKEYIALSNFPERPESHIRALPDNAEVTRDRANAEMKAAGLIDTYILDRRKSTPFYRPGKTTVKQGHNNLELQEKERANLVLKNPRRVLAHLAETPTEGGLPLHLFKAPTRSGKPKTRKTLRVKGERGEKARPSKRRRVAEDGDEAEEKSKDDEENSGSDGSTSSSGSSSQSGDGSDSGDSSESEAAQYNLSRYNRMEDAEEEMDGSGGDD